MPLSFTQQITDLQTKRNLENLAKQFIICSQLCFFCEALNNFPTESCSIGNFFLLLIFALLSTLGNELEMVIIFALKMAADQNTLILKKSIEPPMRGLEFSPLYLNIGFINLLLPLLRSFFLSPHLQLNLRYVSHTFSSVFNSCLCLFYFLF